MRNTDYLLLLSVLAVLVLLLVVVGGCTEAERAQVRALNPLAPAAAPLPPTPTPVPTAGPTSFPADLAKAIGSTPAPQLSK